MKILAIIAFLTASLIAADSPEKVPLTIAGSVAHPGAYTVVKEDASFSTLLERAGGILPSGSDHIRISFPVGDDIRVLVLRAGEFYSKDRDFYLPPKASVYVVECAALGLGNLTPAEFARLEEKRSNFLRRKREGKIEMHDLLPQKG